MINTTLQQNTTEIIYNPTTTSTEILDTKYMGFQIIVNFFTGLLLFLTIMLYCYRQKITSKGCISKCAVIMSILGGILFIVLFNGTTINEYIQIQEGLWSGYSTLGLLFLVIPLSFFLGGSVALLIDYILKYIKYHQEKKRIFRVLPKRLINTV